MHDKLSCIALYTCRLHDKLSYIGGMMPSSSSTSTILTPDLLANICSHLTTVHQLATPCAVNRATSAYLLGDGSAQHWMDAARLVCGSVDDCEEGGRDLARKTMCPWLSVLTSINLGYRSLSVREVFSCCRGACDILFLGESGKLAVDSIRVDGNGGFTRDVDSSENNYLCSAAAEDPYRLRTKDLRAFLLRCWHQWFSGLRCHHSIQAIFRVHDSLFAAFTLDSVLFVSPDQRRILHTLPNVRVLWKRGAECVFFGSGEIWIVDENGTLLCWT